MRDALVSFIFCVVLPMVGAMVGLTLTLMGIGPWSPVLTMVGVVIGYVPGVIADRRGY